MIESITKEKLENAIKLYKHADVIVNTSLLTDYLIDNHIRYGLCQLLLRSLFCSSEEIGQLSKYIEEICIKLDIPFTYQHFSTFYVGDGPLLSSNYKERDIKYRIQILQYMLEQN